MTFADGKLSLDTDDTTVIKGDDGVSAVNGISNAGTLTVLGNADPEPYPFDGFDHPVKQTCDGRIFADPSGGWAGTYAESGSMAEFDPLTEKEVCVPVKCKSVCDDSQPLRLVYRGCIEIAGTWTRNKLSNALSASVDNHISVMNPDGTINCKTQGRECFTFLNQDESNIEVFRLSNSYFINGCVDCYEGLKIRLRSTQSGTVVGANNLFLNDAFYRMNLNFMLLRQCE